jgi:hypothetical protein
MWIYGALAKLLPESKFKTRARDFCFGKVLFNVTCGTVEHPFKHSLTGRFHKLLFLPNGEYTCELTGYEKHYSIKEGDIVVDAGAYLGHFTVYAALRVGPRRATWLPGWCPTPPPSETTCSGGRSSARG